MNAFVKTPPTHLVEDLFDEDNGESSYAPNGGAWRRDNHSLTIKRNKLSSARKLRLRPRLSADLPGDQGQAIGNATSPTHVVEEVIKTDAGYRYRPVGHAWPITGGDIIVDLEKSTDSKTLRLRPIRS